MDCSFIQIVKYLSWRIDPSLRLLKNRENRKRLLILLNILDVITFSMFSSNSRRRRNWYVQIERYRNFLLLQSRFYKTLYIYICMCTYTYTLFVKYSKAFKNKKIVKKNTKIKKKNIRHSVNVGSIEKTLTCKPQL
jgi:hypothetical protein